MGELDSFVLEQLRDLGRDPAAIEATLAADRRHREERRPEIGTELRTLGAERSRLEDERRRLVEAVTGKEDDAAPAVVQRLGEVEAELARSDRRRDELHREHEALDGEPIDPDELKRALADLEPVWGELFPAERARLLELLLERVVLDAQAGEVELRFRPGGPAALGRER